MKDYRIIALLIALVVACVVAIACSQQQADDVEPWKFEEISEEERHPLLLVGLDGFKPEYLDPSYGASPNLNRLIDGGVWAESLKPVFPSHTFPNLYSIATGLYPANHGIVGNTVYDPERDVRFSMGDADEVSDPRWWGGEPIWVTAELQGLAAATFFWVGSEAPIKDTQPTHWIKYDSRIRHDERTDQVIEWLSDDENPVDFATLYFATVDGSGHEHGPGLGPVQGAVASVDHQIGRLINGLEEAGIWPNINIIIVSDHGMTDLDDEKVIFLDDFINLSHVHMIEWTPVATIDPRPGRTDSVYESLKENEENYKVYRRGELPDHLHFEGNPRIPEIVVVADKPYTLTSRSYFEQNGVSGGGHGYDPEYSDMHGIFLATGPDFPSGITTQTLELVDVYALMAHLLALTPAEHDGSLERIGDQVFGE